MARARSKSPLASMSALRQSMTPAPVASRSFCTDSAEISFDILVLFYHWHRFHLDSFLDSFLNFSQKPLNAFLRLIISRHEIVDNIGIGVNVGQCDDRDPT